MEGDLTMYLCAGVTALVIFVAIVCWPTKPRRRRGYSYLRELEERQARMAASEQQASQPRPFVHEKSPSSEHYRWLQQEYAKKAFEQARENAPRDYARLANLAGTVADLKEGRGGRVPERVQREQSETTLFVQVERRRSAEREGAIEVTNHPLFSRRK